MAVFPVVEAKAVLLNGVTRNIGRFAQPHGFHEPAKIKPIVPRREPRPVFRQFQIGQKFGKVPVKRRLWFGITHIYSIRQAGTKVVSIGCCSRRKKGRFGAFSILWYSENPYGGWGTFGEILSFVRHGMPLDRAKKDQIIKKYKVHDTDTGSAEVQIAILTEEISQLTDHLKTHKKDFSSRRGLLMKIGQRRRLLRYLEKQNPASHAKLLEKLKLKK